MVMEIYFDTVKLYSTELKRLASSVPGRLISSILDGVVGSIILLLFCSLLVAEQNLLQLLPWILAFNTAVSGYSFVKKCYKEEYSDSSDVLGRDDYGDVSIGRMSPI